MALHLEDGETYIEGRSPKKAKELLGKAKAAGLEGSVSTTSHGYIVPTSILDGKKAAAKDTDDTAGDDDDRQTSGADGDTGDTGAADADGDADVFDPGAHNVDEVVEYLDSANEEERERVLTAEREGKNRKGLADYEGAK